MDGLRKDFLKCLQKKALVWGGVNSYLLINLKQKPKDEYRGAQSMGFY